ncbi:MAG: ABC transporter permease [Bacteroidota bacterium]
MSRPPGFWLRFFRWYCHPEYLEDLEGDLRERYEHRIREKPLHTARLGFMIDVLRLFRPSIIKPFTLRYQLNDYDMLRNNLKLAYRKLSTDKAFSLINILGLTFGIAASIVIFRYVDFERSYDDFHSNKDHIYRLTAEIKPREIQTALVHPPLGPRLTANNPEIVNFTRMILPWSGQAVQSTISRENSDGQPIKQSFKWGFYVDPGFLEIFSFALVQGNRSTALAGANKVVISESAAKKIFGNDWENEEIIGQQVEYVNEFDRFDLTITGVISDAPENSHFKYDFLASFSTLSTGWGKGYAETWNGNSVYTYLQLAPNTNVEALMNKAENYLVSNSGDPLSNSTDLSLQPLTDIYLGSALDGELKVNTNASYVAFLFYIGIAILLIAIINYINLTTAKAVGRSHEVGLRKVLGAQRNQLINQFLFESFLINAFALILAAIVIFTSSPYLNDLMGKPVVLISWDVWKFLIFLFPITVLLSGLYPAFVLSGYLPLKTLKGKLIHSKSGVFLRKTLVVFQFWVSIGLIIFTFIVYRQLNHMRNSETGFQKEGVLVVNGPVNRHETWIEHDQLKDTRDYTDVFKTKITQYSAVNATTLSWSIPGEKSSVWPIDLGPKYSNGKLSVINADSDYSNVYGLQLLAGEFNTQNGVVINQKATEILKLTDLNEAIGKEFRDARGRNHRINGIIKDYHHSSLQEDIKPIMFQENDPTYKLDSYYSLKLTLGNLQGKLKTIEEAYKDAYPNDPFNYYFIDDYFEAQYQSDSLLGKMFGGFSAIAMFIAVIGLLGLSIYTVSFRTKEIGIRKVLGASVVGIVALLNKNILLLILLSSILAVPLTFWLTNNWLSNYAFRIDLGWVFILPTFLIPIIVIIAVSVLSMKAAYMNPVDTLRDE